MKNKPDEESIEFLLKGSISEPSKRFEEALRNIPDRETSRSRRNRLLVMAPLAVAAMLVLTTILILRPIQRTPASEPSFADSVEDLDSEWLELFSLADAVAEVDTLTDEETRMALEFYAFNQ